MNLICSTTPAPSCVVPLTHPARPYTSWDKTDIRETFARHQPIFVCPVQDDYELTNALDWLEQGGFK